MLEREILPAYIRGMTDTITSKILVLFAHPVFHRSRVHQVLRQAITGLHDVTVHDLYFAYPDLDIDVRAEQALLEDHDVVVMQFPLYWYSTPSILKEWQDQVLEHGWAYGSTTGVLKGKRFMIAVSAGGGEQAYCSDGQNHFDIRDFLCPLEGMANLCKMQFLPPFVVFGTHLLEQIDLDSRGEDYRRVICALRDGKILETGIHNTPIINRDLAKVIG